MAVVFVLSVRPFPQQMPEVSGSDKLYHFIAYAVMAALWARAVRDRVTGNKRIVFIATMIAAVFGVLMEVCQAFTGYRSAEALDGVANALGGLSGSYIYVLIAGKTR